MDSNSFRSTVLQRPQTQMHPQDDDGERDRHQRRDTMNAGSPSQSAHRQSSTFRLRSPTGTSGATANGHNPPPFPSPRAAHQPHQHPHQNPHQHRPPHHPPHHHHHQSPPPSSHRSALHTPATAYMSQQRQGSPSGAGGPMAPTLPPPSGLAPPPASSSSSSAANHRHHQGVSPLHPPSGTYYPPPGAADPHHHGRDAGHSTSTRSFYDPTTDTTKERRVSDSWHNAPQAATPKVSLAVHIHLFDSPWHFAPIRP